MSWDEIYDEKQISGIHIPKDSVILKTKHKFFGPTKTIKHYLFNIFLGTNVLKSLGWTVDTTLKFQWGKEENLGKVRIAVILNQTSGWHPRIYKIGYGMISNKALPKNEPFVVKIERDVELVYSIVEDDRQAGVFILEVQLPDDFYESVSPKKDTTQTNFSASQLPLKPPYIEKETKAPAQNPTVASAPNKSAAIPKSNGKTSLSEDQMYDLTVKNGGMISIDHLCKYLRIFLGDSVSPSSIPGKLDFNGEPLSYEAVLASANSYRRKKREPLFSL